MKKQEIYVPIANKKEAKRAKAVLEAMGEVIDENYFRSSYDENEGGLYFNEKYKTWVIAISFRHPSNTRTKTTLKQLIELLVSEQNDKAKSTVEEKIAVRVDNEKEFNALMKYYDSLGWKSAGKHNPLDLNFDGDNYVSYHHMFYYTRQYELKDYKIIPFSEFAKEHGLRVPLLVSEDGVKLFEWDEHYFIYKRSNGIWKLKEEKCILLPSPKTIKEPYNNPDEFINNKDDYKAFSTKQSALDWIEAQKPKVIEFCLNGCTNKVKVDKDYARIDCLNGIGLMLQKTDVERIHEAMEELNS